MMNIFQPIPQDLAYHNFADQRTVFINNFYDVCSNLVFILIGLYFLSLKKNRNNYNIIIKMMSLTMILVGLGSAYYHYNPNNDTLVWDRLPMALAFSTLLYVVLCDNSVIKNNSLVLYSGQLVSILSVIWWALYDDLRYYGLVQFGSILVVVILLLKKCGGKKMALKDRYLGYSIILYIFAKVFENYDQQIYMILPISGHTLKHLIAGWGSYYAILYIVSIKNNVFEFDPEKFN